MRPRQRWVIYFQVLAQIFDGTSRVSYERFLRHLDRRRKRSTPEFRVQLRSPSRATYSRVWRAYCRQRGVLHVRKNALLHLLLRAMAVGVWDLEARPKAALPSLRAYLADQHVMPPSDTVLLRQVHAARGRALLHRRNRREQLLAGAIETTISDLPIARKLRAQRVLRIPPVSRGKVGRAKIEQESIYRQEIEGALSANHQAIDRLLAQPGLDSEGVR